MRARLAALMLIVLFAAGCASANTVDLVEYAFQPASLTVAHGQAVQFRNTGRLAHTVTIHDDNGQVALDKVLQAGESVSFTPPTAGDYHVFCRFHSDRGMEMSLQAT